MYIQKLNLFNFKNYEDLSVQFNPFVNCIVGPNGSGKTNLLDAIYFLCLTKSSLNNIDSQLIKHEEPNFIVKGWFSTGEKEHTVTGSVQRGQKKTILFDNNSYDKLTEHIGKLPLVLIAPNDTDLIREGSETRRKFFDGIIGQFDLDYLFNLIKYSSLLKQRNSLLKETTLRKKPLDRDLLEAYDTPLLDLNQKLYSRRKEAIDQFSPHFSEAYACISDTREDVKLTYQSQVSESTFSDSFQQALSRDLATQRTSFGVHKDDFRFEIDGFPVKKFGSQGQQKSFVISLQLAKYNLLKEQKDQNPVLLLDDIFDKLDDLRIERLVEMVLNKSFGQVFITDANPQRVDNIFADHKSEIDIFEVSNGMFVPRD